MVLLAKLQIKYDELLLVLLNSVTCDKMFNSCNYYITEIETETLNIKSTNNH